MRERYPEIEPYAHGLLDVGDGSLLYWEACGNPDGKPPWCSTAALARAALPACGAISIRRRIESCCSTSATAVAAGRTPATRRSAWPPTQPSTWWRTSSAAQRCWASTAGWCSAGPGAARSRSLTPSSTPITCPSSSSPGTRPLAAPRSTCSPGASAGCSRRPGPATGTACPRPSGTAASPPPTAAPCWTTDPAVRAQAASDWCEWEEAMLPTSPHNARYDDPAFRMCFARIVTHYWSNDHFLADRVLLAEAGRLGPVPGVIIQGNLDLVNLARHAVAAGRRLARQSAGAHRRRRSRRQRRPDLRHRHRDRPVRGPGAAGRRG